MERGFICQGLGPGPAGWRKGFAESSIGSEKEAIKILFIMKEAFKNYRPCMIYLQLSRDWRQTSWSSWKTSWKASWKAGWKTSRKASWKTGRDSRKASGKASRARELVWKAGSGTSAPLLSLTKSHGEHRGWERAQLLEHLGKQRQRIWGKNLEERVQHCVKVRQGWRHGTADRHRRRRKSGTSWWGRRQLDAKIKT